MQLWLVYFFFAKLIVPFHCVWELIAKLEHSADIVFEVCLTICFYLFFFFTRGPQNIYFLLKIDTLQDCESFSIT